MSGLFPVKPELAPILHPDLQSDGQNLRNGTKNGDPNGIRTRVTAVKGRCPKPLDDRVSPEPQNHTGHFLAVTTKFPGNVTRQILQEILPQRLTKPGQITVLCGRIPFFGMITTPSRMK